MYLTEEIIGKKLEEQQKSLQDGQTCKRCHTDRPKLSLKCQLLSVYSQCCCDTLLLNFLFTKTLFLCFSSSYICFLAVTSSSLVRSFSLQYPLSFATAVKMLEVKCLCVVAAGAYLIIGLIAC